jgi:hypothetical protein
MVIFHRFLYVLPGRVINHSRIPKFPSSRPLRDCLGHSLVLSLRLAIPTTPPAPWWRPKKDSGTGRKLGDRWIEQKVKMLIFTYFY